MIYSDENRKQLPREDEWQIGSVVWKSGSPDGKCCGEKRISRWEVFSGKVGYTEGVAGSWNDNRSTKSALQSTDGD